MKSTINEEKGFKQPTFPKLYRANERHLVESYVVLFTNYNSGMVVWREVHAGWNIGDHSRSWVDCTNTDYWLPFEGSITLEND